MPLPVLNFQPQQYTDKNYLAEALSNFVPNVEKGMETGAEPFKLQKSLLAQELANKINRAKANVAPQMEQANLEQAQAQPALTRASTAFDIANTNKLNQMTPLEATKMSIENQYLPQKQKADIASLMALSNYRNMGGGRAGVGATEHLSLQTEIAKTYPNLTPEQVHDTANAYLEGRPTLSDGTEVPKMTGLISSKLDQITKRGSTASLITQNTRANQAEKELTVLNDYAQKGLKPYGDTYLNMSPQQITDSFKSDPDSQKKLGRLVASQALQYEAAQNRIRLANGQPGVTSTEELMKLSGQMLNTKFPKLSYAARKEAADYMDEALREGLKARNSIGIGAQSASGQPKGIREALAKVKGESAPNSKVTKTWTMDELRGLK